MTKDQQVAEQQTEMLLAEQAQRTSLNGMQMKMADAMMDSQEKVSRANEFEAMYRAQAAKSISDREAATTETSKITHEKLVHQSVNMFRPTTMMRPEITRYEGEWQAVYGEVIGMGPTPELACQDFDRVWLGKEI